MKEYKMKKIYKDLRKFNKKQINKTLLFNTKEKDKTGRHEMFMKQRKKYGFDERETWALNYTSILWLYTHLKRYRKWGGAVEMDDPEWAFTYVINLIKKDENGNYLYKEVKNTYLDKEIKELEFERELVELPYGKIVDVICEYFEYYINHGDDTDHEDLAYSLVQEGIKLYGEIFGSLWW